MKNTKTCDRNKKEELKRTRWRPVLVVARPRRATTSTWSSGEPSRSRQATIAVVVKGDKKRPSGCLPQTNPALTIIRKCCFHGGGGNRTRVPWRFSARFYVCSLL